MVETGFRWQDDAPRFCALEECAGMRVIGEHLGDCACMICKQEQENQDLKRKLEQREQKEINLPPASREAEAKSAELASEFMAQAVADIAEATTLVTDRSTAAFTTQQTPAGVMAEQELSQQ